jgi:hypothetical protein
VDIPKRVFDEPEVLCEVCRVDSDNPAVAKDEFKSFFVVSEL